ncbi:TetR/AcrR family transcriptional regulator [Nocardioides zeae]|uniref:TetR/AcrR family transcriptional regulator n=1 Tax=Nocardioides imazamoxiresistens TaxID=3231893 RepID=A0ABU3PZA9_9ACTN|nr:TetR/AcrR family transcriptional regulator [Nocardioides zeae]MDT9594105.1 TetR/AcrR family transcriptional regulator [Nocardioides zeae]
MTSSLRREPRQARSRAMVERIVDAARAVLAAEGYDAFSTNRVAAAAGVSPGSLYQYFPDKTALVDVLARQWVDRMSDDVAGALLAHVDAEAPDLLRSAATALLDAVERDPLMLRIVWLELPGARNVAARDALERRVRDVLTTYLRLRHPATAERADRLAWVLVLTAQQLTVRFVLDPDPPLTREQLVDELVAVSAGVLGVPGVPD